jgi:uncharacterized cupredoxin-like copper-binding protein
MKLRKRFALFVLAMGVAAFLAACGGSKTIDAALTSYKITISDSSASAGEVTFHVHNDATDDLTHEFVVFKTDFPADQLPLTAEGIVDEEAAGITLIDEAEDIEPGASTDLTVTLDPGKYVLVCNVDSDELHYQHGMHVAFTVK